MSDSYTLTATETFTLTHAKYIAAKVAADLSRFRRFYNSPSIEEIAAFEEELTALLKEDYLDNIIYGFMRNGKWVEALRYHALPGGYLMQDDDPGKIRPGIDLTGASFGSFLIWNSRWCSLSQAEKDKFYEELTIKRGHGIEPPLESGVWSQGQSYSAGGHGIRRSIINR